MHFDTILLGIDDATHVATITLNRPERLNAAPVEMADEIVHAADLALARKARCLLLTGAGRAFCSGADMTGARSGDAAHAALDRHYNPLMRKLADLPIPVVAAVNGPAAGIGCSIALAADLVVAARSAYFLQAFVNIGLVPDGGATWTLPRLVGKARAFEMMMLGERIDAERALDWGMIHSVADDAALAEQAHGLAARLAAGPTLAHGLMRRLAAENMDRDYRSALDAEAVAQGIAGNSEDARIGAVAFAAKQTPGFRGH